MSEKSLIQYCERSDKTLLKMPKTVHCYQRGHFQKDKKLVENAKIRKNATFWVFFKQCALAKNLEFDFLCRIKTSITQNCVYDVCM